MEKEFDLAVSWWPFELHPETPRTGREVAELLEPGRRTQAYREHLKSYAAEAGIELASNRRVSNSHRSLELAEFGRDRGRFQEVHEALFRDYFEKGEDIGDEQVLERIAAACGLDLEEWRFESRTGRYALLVDRTTAVAREKGFTSTPTMIIDDRMVVTGAQDELVYRDVLKRLGASPPADAGGVQS